MPKLPHQVSCISFILEHYFEMWDGLIHISRQKEYARKEFVINKLDDKFTILF